MQGILCIKFPQHHAAFARNLKPEFHAHRGNCAHIFVENREVNSAVFVRVVERVFTMLRIEGHFRRGAAHIRADTEAFAGYNNQAVSYPRNGFFCFHVKVR